RSHYYLHPLLAIVFPSRLSFLSLVERPILHEEITSFADGSHDVSAHSMPGWVVWRFTRPRRFDRTHNPSGHGMRADVVGPVCETDRKSTRTNSRHQIISSTVYSL